MAVAVGAHTDHQAHPAHLDNMGSQVLKASQALPAILPKTATPDQSDPLAPEDTTEIQANKAHRENQAMVQKQARGVTLVIQEPGDNQEDLVPTPKKDIQAAMELLAHLVPLALTVHQAHQDQKAYQEDPVNVVNLAKMLNTVLARVVPGLRRPKPKPRLRPRPRPKLRHKAPRLR